MLGLEGVRGRSEEQMCKQIDCVGNGGVYRGCELV